MQFFKTWYATVNRWRMYKFTALAVIYGACVGIVTGPMSCHDAIMALVWTHPILAFLAIYGFTFRKPLL